MSIKTPTTTIWEGAGVTNMARVEGWDKSNIVQADIASARYWVIKSDGTKEVDGTSLTVADIIFDTLQTDAKWGTDSTGYNFRHHVSGSDVPDGATTYRVEYELTPASADFSDSPIYLVFKVVTTEVEGTG